MKTIIIKEADFNINDYYSTNKFNKKLQEITEPFEVKFDYEIPRIPSFLFCETKLAKITLPSSIEIIEPYAFSTCSLLKKITLPSSIERIDKCAFEYCSSLTEITLPNSVTHVGAGTFHFCTSLSDINFSSSITEISDNAFEYCNSLTKITLPSSITKINNGAFGNCESLKEINLSSSLTEICAYAFTHCISLKSIFLPSSVKILGHYAFSNCPNLEDVTFSKNITFTGFNVFEKTKWIKDKYKEQKPIYIDFVFYSMGKSEISSLSIKENTTQIADFAFNHSCIKEIELPTSLMQVNDSNFFNCNNLQKILIKQSQEHFLSNVKGAKDFYNKYKNLIIFEDPKSLDALLTKNNSLEQIITNLEPEH